MDMLFNGHRTQGEDGTPAPVGFDFASRHNRDPAPDGSQDSHGSDNNDNDHNYDNMSVGNQAESSAAAARRAPNRSTAQGTGAVHPSHSTDVDESESDSDAVSDAASHHHLVSNLLPILVTWCNDPTIGSCNHYHLCPNGIPRGNQRWYGLVYFIQIAGKPRIRPRQLLSSFEVLY